MAGDVGEGGAPRRKRVRKAAAPGTEIQTKAQAGLLEHEMRRAGLSWPEVARRRGYNDPARARAEHARFMQLAVLDMEIAERRTALMAELERLDFLQSEHWEAATTGRDLDSAKFVLSVIQARIKLLRLDDDLEDTGAMRTVVIAGNHRQYVATMKELLNEQEAVDAEVLDG